jgi:hypothetical protein
LEVRHDGVDIFADPRTYCYHGEPEWREWFRSTAGHNTVELDSLNQADSRRALPLDHAGPDHNVDL